MGLFRRRDGGAAEPTGDWSAPPSAEDMPPALADLTFLALDHSLDSIENGGPLIPLVLADTSTGRALRRFAAETLEDGVASARHFVQDDDGWHRACLSYDGYLTVADVEYDAIHVRAWDRETTTAIHVAHCYVPGTPDVPLQRISGPLYLGPGGPPTA